jgi:hypothetical protein
MLPPTIVLAYTTCFSYLLRTCTFLVIIACLPHLCLIIYRPLPHGLTLYKRLVQYLVSVASL